MLAESNDAAVVDMRYQTALELRTDETELGATSAAPHFTVDVHTGNSADVSIMTGVRRCK